MLHKKKRKILPEILIVLSISVVILAIIIVINFKRIQLMMKGYNFTEQSIILKLDDEQIEYFINFDELVDLRSWDAITSNKHYLEYQIYQKDKKDLSKKEVVKYIDTLYQDYYKKLKTLKYSYNQIMSLTKSVNLNDFKILIDNSLSYDQIKPYLNIKGMIFDDLPKYIASKKENIDAVLSITYPFIDAKNKVTKEYQILEPNKLLVLIKKGFILPRDYIPKNLVIPNIPIAPNTKNNMLRKDAAEALEKMYQAALKEDNHLVLNSGYRSYESQIEIYQEYFRKYDEVTASGLVAKPGSSEHQLGLGIDLTSQSVIDKQRLVFGDTAEYKWVVKNAYKYGFIVRYPKDRSTITGTSNEPWHLRYVGKKAAKIIYKNDWTLEEYILENGFTYNLKSVD